MSAVDEIQAAIEKLTEYKARGYFADNGWLIEIDDTITYPDDPRRALTNDDYMVTLHRTIDAQLDTLRTARGFYGAAITGPEVATLFAEHALILARAINGVNS